MNKVQKIMLGAAAVSMLASCSSEFDGPQSATDTQSSAVKVTAEIGALSSRVSNFTSWEANDVIGLSTSIDPNIPYITKDGSGIFEPKGSDILYIKGNKEVTVSGYYPYSENVTNGSISFDVATDENPDFLFATTSAKRDNPAVKFTFNHVMSRLVFNFNVEIDSYSLKGLVTTGTFDIVSGTITNGNVGDITGTKTQVITTFLPPQTMNSVKLIFTKDGISYSAPLGDDALKAGTQYTYSVTLNETGVDVTFPQASTISGFTNTDKGELTYTEQEPEMAVGDWYLSDGTTVSHTKTLTEEQKGKVIGVVVYAGNPSTTALATYFNNLEGCSLKGACDPNAVTVDYMAVNYQGCTKGIVMATAGRDEKKPFFAEDMTTTVTEWWNGQTDLKNTTLAPSGDKISKDNVKIGDSYRNYCLGVQNTYILEKYVEAENSVAAIDNLKNFREANQTPDGTTGWYIPSPTEIAQFLFGSTTEGVNAVINSSLKAVGATQINANDQYWSSSEAPFKDNDSTNPHQWCFGRVKKKVIDSSTDPVTYTYIADNGGKADASKECYNIYFLAF